MDILMGGTPGNLFSQKLTILNGAAGLSEICCTQGKALVAIIMPATWVAAAIGYRAGLNQRAADLYPVYSASGNGLMLTTAVASEYIAFPMSDAVYAPFIQLASLTAGTGAAAVDQTADRDIVLLFRNYLD